MSYLETYQEWLHSPALSPAEKAELESIANDPKEIESRFFDQLSFGTAGLRGTMCTGLHQMNVHVIRHTTQAFAEVVKAEGAAACAKGVAICFDCRNHSAEFAKEAACVMAANGIQVRLFEAMRPTPELSFAIRKYGCQAGINVTASHNPKEYNGYKAYWEDGAQVLAPHDKGIIDEVNKVKMEDVKLQAVPELIEIIGGEVDYDYMQAVHEAMIDQDVILRHKDLNIVYSAMHGAGRVIVPLCLRSWGFQNIHVVPEQMVIDGNCPTVVSPNPENAEAMTLGMKMGTRLNADLVVATDPDADRLAIVCRDNKGEWMIINGNQTCAMFCYYIIRNKKALNQLQPTDFLVKTIVTTELVAKMAEKNHVELRDCYTGFKWIAREIAISEGKQKFIGGGEESFGFLPYDKVRDKDAPAAICLICEIAAWAKDNGMTLYDLLMQLYLEYGFSYEHTINVVKPYSR